MVDFLVSLSGPFGLLLPGLACVAWLTLTLGRLVFRDASRAELLCGGAVLTLSLATATMQVLLYAGWMYRAVVVGCLAAATAAATWAERKHRPAGETRLLLGWPRLGWPGLEWDVTPGHVIGFTLVALGLHAG